MKKERKVLRWEVKEEAKRIGSCWEKNEGEKDLLCDFVDQRKEKG